MNTAIILINKDNTINFMCNNIIPEGICVDSSLRIVEIKGVSAETVQGGVPPEYCVWDDEHNMVRDMRYFPQLIKEYPDFDTYSYVKKCEVRRKQRDSLLNKLDSVVRNPMRWEEFSDETKTELRNYRNMLKDIPKQKGFPNNVEWPKKPKVIE